jgi:putative ABC transport system permease protein
VPGVKRVAVQNWFGGQDPADTQGLLRAVRGGRPWYGVYRKDSSIVDARRRRRRGVPAGADPRLALLPGADRVRRGQKLLKKKGWKLGQTITLAGTIYPGTWPFTIRAVYHAKKKSFGDETMFFHYKYLDEKGMGGSAPWARTCSS